MILNYKVFIQYIYNLIYISANKTMTTYADKVYFAWEKHDPYI